MYEDYGWEFVTSCQNFIIFSKAAVKGDLEIYGDRESKLVFVKTIIQRRYLLCLGLYFILIVMNQNEHHYVFTFVLSAIYIPLLLLIGYRFYRMMKTGN